MTSTPKIQNAQLLKDALNGLTRIPKSLESKWFYDGKGSLLFEEITRLPEYYPTRTELSILKENAQNLEKYVPAGHVFVELGSGASKKTRVLLDQFKDLAAYVPTDISGPFLNQTARGLRAEYPNLAIDPILADFTTPIPIQQKYHAIPKTAFFPGSTIGNLAQKEAIALLARIRDWDGITGFILGLDLIKDTKILVDAYDDKQGVTSAFNKNLLARLNREAGAAFDLNTFKHEARWDAKEARIEMHLVSTVSQIIRIGSEEISFGKGESIHTENSHKYSRESLAEMAQQSGWHVQEFFTDANALFAVSVLTPI